ncbi:MAG: Abi family protein [Oscillospiraceae bacterium]|nr:Abi family protein [Oscillospiraceae bacterium]
MTVNTNSLLPAVKSPKTYEEQVEIIKSKGFVVEDEEKCIDFLHRANYYRLSAYFLPFKKEDGTYLSDTNFSKVQRIYDFDCRMRATLFECIEEIELFLRTQLSYEMGHKYGALGYLNPDNFSDDHNSEKFNNNLERCIEANKRSLVVKHHIKRYSGQFPLWVIIEFFSMGMLSYFYSDLKTPDQKHLARIMYSTNPACLKSWLRCITDLRNLCAHSARLYAWIFTAAPRTEKRMSYQLDRSLFSQIMVLRELYPMKNRWNSTVAAEISALVDEYSEDILLRHIGFPENWRELLFF